ncbi:cytochrome o ubiquinol oxidase subunit IV [Novosphingobium rosa]|uniref:cytochrome o ubiquinol oxidase subunit IV n=1 Tax=Novosphingobium rosa TaxID=76978 RepID=UPI0008327341|nr:cytochrome o ubiquinol oxidase subunit IV [Novosphingobium rosa]
MSDPYKKDSGDTVPGEGEDGAASLRGYTLGLALALLLTGASFWVASTNLVWAPSVPVAIVVLAVAQMGVHLVFFLHVTTGPDNTNNVLALAFGTLVVLLVIVGSIWIMGHLSHGMAMDHAAMGNMP